jgi:hypothetical protein
LRLRFWCRLRFRLRRRLCFRLGRGLRLGFWRLLLLLLRQFLFARLRIVLGEDQLAGGDTILCMGRCLGWPKRGLSRPGGGRCGEQGAQRRACQ